MTLTIELTPEQEAKLRTVAQGKSMEETLQTLIEQIPSVSTTQEQTWGARVLAELQAEGVLGMWQDRPEDGPELAKKLREEAQQRGPLLCP